MTDETERTPVEAPRPSPPPSGLKRLASLGAVGAVLLAKLKVFVPLLNVLKAAKFLTLFAKFGTTAITMLISIWFYSLRFGWTFAVGFVLLILVHEMGHVLAATRFGVPITAPLFIPGFGALILQKKAAGSVWEEAVIGIGGPVAGAAAAFACYMLALAFDSPFMMALAYTGFFLNLFNLIPVYPLDGGWIVGAISPRLWALGICGLIALFAFGWVRNPYIPILVILSLPKLWRGIRSGSAASEGQIDVSVRQRAVMGVSYLALVGVLVFLMMESHFGV